MIKIAARVVEEEMFGVDNLCWISAKATLESSRLAEFLILQTGMTAFGKAYYRYQHDLVPNVRTSSYCQIHFQNFFLLIFIKNEYHCVHNYYLQLASKLEALRDEYMRFAVDKCSSVLRENHFALEKITGIFRHSMWACLHPIGPYYWFCYHSSKLSRYFTWQGRD